VIRRVVLDTGPLVAAVNRRDAYHGWATSQLKRARPPLLTCEAVLAEACHLLRRVPGGCRAVLEMVDRRVVALPFRVEEDTDSVSALMEKYADAPMSFADACLFRLAENVPRSRVLTLDTDFTTYRSRRRRPIPTILPEDRS